MEKGNTQPKYERREREKSEKGKWAEKQAVAKEEKKKQKLKPRQSSHNCKICGNIIPGNGANNNVCAGCNEPLHYKCATDVSGDYAYCKECINSCDNTEFFNVWFLCKTT